MAPSLTKRSIFMNERNLNLPPNVILAKRTTREKRAFAGAVLGGLGLVYIVEDGSRPLRSRRTALLMMLGAAAGYIAGPLTPTFSGPEK